MIVIVLGRLISLCAPCNEWLFSAMGDSFYMGSDMVVTVNVIYCYRYWRTDFSVCILY